MKTDKRYFTIFYSEYILLLRNFFPPANQQIIPALNIMRAEKEEV